MFGPHLYGHHPLLWAYGYGRQHTRRATSRQPTRRLSLLNPAHKPGQQRHGTHEEHHNEQGLGHAATIHG
jgi:hypothetical protein